MRDPACALDKNSLNCHGVNVSLSMVTKLSFIRAAIGHAIRFATILAKLSISFDFAQDDTIELK